MTELTPPQRDRLLQSARLVAAAFEALITAKAMDVPRSVLLSAEADFNQDSAEFERLRGVRGLLPGDLIEIVVEGPWKGQQGVIRDWDYGHGPRLAVDWPEGSPCYSAKGVCVPHANEVTLVEAEHRVPVPRETSGATSE